MNCANMLPISSACASSLVLNKLPAVSPASNFDLYCVVQGIFNHLKNADFFGTVHFLGD